MSPKYFIIGLAIGFISTVLGPIMLNKLYWMFRGKDRCQKGEECGCDEFETKYSRYRVCENKRPKNK